MNPRNVWLREYLSNFAINNKQKKESSWIVSYACIGCVLLFITLFALAVGTIPSIYAAEVFRQHARGTALALANMSGCVTLLLVTFYFPILRRHIQQYAFLVFAAVLSIIFGVLYKKVIISRWPYSIFIIELIVYFCQRCQRPKENQWMRYAKFF